MTKYECQLRRPALFLVFVVFGSLPRLACSDTDVFAAWGGQWRVSNSGTGSWRVINVNPGGVGNADLRFGDFDGNGRTDVFAASGGRWRVSYNGSSAWKVINNSNIPFARLGFGDFDGDGKTDVFARFGGRWRMSSGGTGAWQELKTSNFGVAEVGFGDFDGDGKTDVFAAWGGKWRISSGGTGAWQEINTSNIGVARLRFGDFDGDGRTDVFTNFGGKWRMSSGGTGAWQALKTSNFGVADLRFGDFDGDGRTDVFAAWGGKWRTSSGGTGAWQEINTSTLGVARLGFGNFNGNGSSSDTRTHVGLRIARFTTNDLTDADADTILASMSSMLQTVDGGNDVACMVQFKRAGVVTEFATGNGIINTAAEMTAVQDLPGHVKVVNQINVCGELVSFTIQGCAGPGNSQVMVHSAEFFTLAEEGAVWAHEYGHTRGLPHRNEPSALMNGGTLGNRVSSSECTAFHK